MDAPFTYQVWKAFIDKLRESVTSGYHPQASWHVEKASQRVLWLAPLRTTYQEGTRRLSWLLESHLLYKDANIQASKTYHYNVYYHLVPLLLTSGLLSLQETGLVSDHIRLWIRKLWLVDVAGLLLRMSWTQHWLPNCSICDKGDITGKKLGISFSHTYISFIISSCPMS